MNLRTRMRRLRRNESIRAMVRETRLDVSDFVLPYFVIEGDQINRPISSMPGQSQLSIDQLLVDVEESINLGISSVILFGIPAEKDDIGSDATDKDGIICRAVSRLKEQFPQLYVITDVCCCEYTSHGHCGPINNGDVDNDVTLELLQQQVVVQAKSGADMVAPSGMMDGMVVAIRTALDDAGFTQIPIMSYAAKYASAFYGPFREAAESAPQFGDRKSYQMDPANSDEAMREVLLDMEEGADIVMVKPALAYLDIIRRVKDEFQMPTAAYQVSGEYAMIKAAAERNWVDHDRIMMESLLSIKRAGADIILTYFAKAAAQLLQQQ